MPTWKSLYANINWQWIWIKLGSSLRKRGFGGGGSVYTLYDKGISTHTGVKAIRYYQQDNFENQLRIVLILNHLSQQYTPPLGKLLGLACTHFDPPWKDDDDDAEDVDGADDDDETEDVDDGAEDVDDDAEDVDDNSLTKDEILRVPNPF